MTASAQGVVYPVKPARGYVGFVPGGATGVLAQKLGNVKERYASLGIFTMHTTPEKVPERIRCESLRAAKGLKAAGVEPE